MSVVFPQTDEAAQPLQALEVAEKLPREEVFADGRIFRHLFYLVAEGRLETVELPETFTTVNNRQVHFVGYQRPTTPKA